MRRLPTPSTNVHAAPLGCAPRWRLQFSAYLFDVAGDCLFIYHHIGAGSGCCFSSPGCIAALLWHPSSCVWVCVWCTGAQIECLQSLYRLLKLHRVVVVLGWGDVAPTDRGGSSCGLRVADTRCLTSRCHFSVLAASASLPPLLAWSSTWWLCVCSVSVPNITLFIKTAEPIAAPAAPG